jgi:hypothetical protein
MPKKLKCQSKGDFQARYFATFAEEYFKGGNAQGRSSAIVTDLEGILYGLSKVWDSAEEESPEN